MTRKERKIDHIKYALSTRETNNSTFSDIILLHQSIPETSLDDISLQTIIGELSVSSPIMINAMTGGGGEHTLAINRQLSEVAKECHLPMAVGSQMAALKDPMEQDSYRIVRQTNPTGIVFANLGSEATVDQAKLAIHMLEANAIQIHLNVIQELVMPEGDRDFSNTLKNIEAIVKGVSVPVIVKEVGFGMDASAIGKLVNVGVSIIDIGGFGGTNFAKVENERRVHPVSLFNEWGIPTPISLIEATSTYPLLSVISSGGVKTSLDVAKSIALGASTCAIASPILQALLDDGVEGAITLVKAWQEELRYMMCALGVTSIKELQKVPVIIKGETHHWVTERGIDTKKFATRKASLL